MEKLIQSLDGIQKKVESYGDWLDTVDKEFNVFTAIFNGNLMTRELLRYYLRAWPFVIKSQSKEVITKKQIDNSEKVIAITKWMFLAALSNIEFSAKLILKKIENTSFEKLRKKLRDGKWVHLREIMKTSKETGLINDTQYETWRGLTEVRNCVVHNNGISNMNIKYKVDNMEIIFVKDKMLVGELDFFIRLEEAAVIQYYKWIQALINSKMLKSQQLSRDA